MMRIYANTVALVSLVALTDCCATRRQTATQPPPPQTSGSIAVDNTKLDGALRDIVKAFHTGGADAAEEEAKRHSAAFSQGRVRLRIVAREEADVGAIQKLLEEMGATQTGSFKQDVFAWTPVGAIERLAALETVWSLSLILPTMGPAVEENR